jgi:N-acetylglucosaminyldiphosphoundecaprenol N-acetyl-beta-D-mannosaminyltransferase
MNKEIIPAVADFKTMNCIGYKVFVDTLDKISYDSKLLINTINQYSFCMAEKDAEFKTALKNSDILLPDGVGIVFAARLINGQKIKKIAGADLHQHILTELNKVGGSCFYLGSSESTLLKIKEKNKANYPQIKLGYYSPPYKAKFSEEDNEQMINAVNEFKPDVLFVGMTAPKQEKWATENKDALNTAVICSIGAVFDFYADTIKRPGKIWISLGFEWLGRLLKEPKRMSRRYLYHGPSFINIVLKEWVKSKLSTPVSTPQS